MFAVTDSQKISSIELSKWTNQQMPESPAIDLHILTGLNVLSLCITVGNRQSGLEELFFFYLFSLPEIMVSSNGRSDDRLNSRKSNAIHPICLQPETHVHLPTCMNLPQALPEDISFFDQYIINQKVQ